jgi:hypothetical protein
VKTGSRDLESRHLRTREPRNWVIDLASGEVRGLDIGISAHWDSEGGSLNV